MPKLAVLAEFEGWAKPPVAVTAVGWEKGDALAELEPTPKPVVAG